MKQSEKSELTYQKIIQSAMIEFGTKSYDQASLNTICKEYHIPKGLIYHHFKNKDELYLRCLQMCFDDLTEYMKEGEFIQRDVEGGIKSIFERRQFFFKEHPYYCYLFTQTIFQPPYHLKKDIKKIREAYDAFNTSFYDSLLKSVSLKEGYSHQDALECFQNLGEMIQSYDQSQIYEEKELSIVMEQRDQRLYKMLKIMLYGIVKESQSLC